VQTVFIGVVAAVSVAGMLGMIRLAGRPTKPVLIALCGGFFLGCFVLIRAASFHHVDQLLVLRLGGLKINWLLELGSIAWIALGAWLAIRSRPAVPPPGTPNFVWVSADDPLRKIGR
jgi:hypothetical protein